MKYLITGGAGFVGCNLANRLLDQNNEVMVLDNLSRKGVSANLEWLKQKGKNLQIESADIRDAKKIEALCKNVEVIYHTAGQVAVTTSITNPRQDFEINALGTFNVLEGARKSDTDPVLIFTSTNKVYGNLKDLEIEELETRYDFKELKGVPSDRAIEPCTPYGCSKAAADFYCLDYARMYGIKSVVFRMSCIYGARQFGNVDQGWVAHFLLAHIMSKPISIYGNGKQIRDILYIDDLVDAFLLATENIKKTRGQPYAIGGGPENTISLLELVSYVEDKYGKKYNLEFKDWRPGDQKVYYSDVSKAKNDFGWIPSVSTKEGIDKLYLWIKENLQLFSRL